MVFALRWQSIMCEEGDNKTRTIWLLLVYVLMGGTVIRINSSQALVWNGKGKTKRLK
jgi:hypothetical protein